MCVCIGTDNTHVGIFRSLFATECLSSAFDRIVVHTHTRMYARHSAAILVAPPYTDRSQRKDQYSGEVGKSGSGESFGFKKSSWLPYQSGFLTKKLGITWAPTMHMTKNTRQLRHSTILGDLLVTSIVRVLRNRIMKCSVCHTLKVSF